MSGLDLIKTIKIQVVPAKPTAIKKFTMNALLTHLTLKKSKIFKRPTLTPSTLKKFKRHKDFNHGNIIRYHIKILHLSQSLSNHSNDSFACTRWGVHGPLTTRPPPPPLFERHLKLVRLSRNFSCAVFIVGAYEHKKP